MPQRLCQKLAPALIKLEYLIHLARFVRPGLRRAINEVDTVSYDAGEEQEGDGGQHRWDSG